MRDIRFFVFILIVSVILCGCQRLDEGLRQITPEEIEAHIRHLSDDLLEGRMIGEKGLEVAALYQENFFRGLGPEPSFNGSFLKPYELKAGRPDSEASLEIISPGESV